MRARDSYGRTPLHVAAYARQHAAMRALAAGGADPNALENDRYDLVTIAAVADDLPTLKVALRIRRQADQHHQPIRRHGAHRRRASGQRRRRPRTDPRGRAARACEQPGLDCAHRIDRTGRWRTAPRRDAQGTRRRGRECEYRGPRRRAAGGAGEESAATARWSSFWRRRARGNFRSRACGQLSSLKNTLNGRGTSCRRLDRT